MSLQNHVKSLKDKHAATDAKILLLELCPARNELEIRELKKHKLHLKDEIKRLQNPDRATAPKSKKQLSKKAKAKKEKHSLPASVPQLVVPSEPELDRKAA